MTEIETEITVKLKWDLDETKINFVNKGISLTESFVLKDIYLVKKEVDIHITPNLEVLSQSVIIREIVGTKIERYIIYKDKKYDDKCNVISSAKYSCLIIDAQEMYDFLIAIGYKECFRYEQECLAYNDENRNILLQYIPELGLFAELEDNNKSIEELKNDLNNIGIPYYEDDYFVKKASLMLDLTRKKKR